MPQDTLTATMTRNHFYRNNYRLMTTLCLLLVIACIGLEALAYTFSRSCPTLSYFATTTGGKLIKLDPLNHPNMNDADLLKWATNAATAVFSYNFVNYNEAHEAMRNTFTLKGYQDFSQFIKNTDILKAVITKKLIVSAAINGNPVIIQENVLNNLYTWSVQVPLLVAYQSSNEVSQQSVLVNMLVSRIPTIEVGNNIAIDQFTVEEGNA